MPQTVNLSLGCFKPATSVAYSVILRFKQFLDPSFSWMRVLDPKNRKSAGEHSSTHSQLFILADHPAIRQLLK
jgi:hypothetical protein